MPKRKEETIYLGDLVHTLWVARISIIILTVIGFLGGLAFSLVKYSRSEMKKDYTITSSIAVTSVTEDGLFTTRTLNPNYSDIHLAEDMVDSVIYVIQGDKTLRAAIEQLALISITESDIRDNLTLEQYEETQIIEMTLEWDVAEEGIMILEAINRVAPEILIESLKIGNVSVVNAPKSSDREIPKVDIKLWILGAMGGFCAAAGFAVLKFLLFPTIFTVRHIETNFNTDVIGEIPKNPSYFSNKCSLEAVKKSDEKSVVTESFISLAHILRHRLGKEKPVCFCVTSALPNEGKTSLLAELAVQLAAIESKVLMVDLDVHNPSLSLRFLDKVNYYQTLNAVSRGETAPENAVIHLKACLDLLPVYLEKVPLMVNEEILDIVKNLSQQYDYVLIDTSPVGRSADMMHLNKIAQTVLFVVRQDIPLVSDVKAALDRLSKSGISVTGIVLNAVSKPGDLSYYRYTHKSK